MQIEYKKACSVIEQPYEFNTLLSYLLKNIFGLFHGTNPFYTPSNTFSEEPRRRPVT